MFAVAPVKLVGQPPTLGMWGNAAFFPAVHGDRAVRGQAAAEPPTASHNSHPLRIAFCRLLPQPALRAEIPSSASTS